MVTLLIRKHCRSPDLTEIYQRKDQKYRRVRKPIRGLQKYGATLSLLFQLSVVEGKLDKTDKNKFLLACVGTLDTEKH